MYAIGEQLRAPLQNAETHTLPTQHVLGLLKLPKLIKSFLSLILRSRILSFIFGLGSKPDPLSAELYSLLHKKTVMEERQLIEERDIYRASWHQKWMEEKVDFVLTVPYPLPALRNGGSGRATLMSCGYAFIFNLVRWSLFFYPDSMLMRHPSAGLYCRRNSCNNSISHSWCPSCWLLLVTHIQSV